jgi:ABC-type Na+ efflux pump permease subunit
LAESKITPRNVIFIAQKEFRGLKHEKTFLLIVLIQLFIALFSTFLVFGLASFYDPSALGELKLKNTNIAIVDSNENDVYQFFQNSGIHLIPYDTFGDAYTDFQSRQVEAIILISNEPSQGYGLINMEIYLPKSDLKATLVSMQLKKPLEKFEQSVRDIRIKRIADYTPLDLNIMDEPRSSTYFEFLYVALLPLLMFTPAFISGGVAVDLITEEFELKTLDLLLVTPASLLDIVSGKMLLTVIIAPVQAFMWILLLMLNRIVIYNTAAIILFVFIIALILVLASSIISLVFKERGLSQLFYSLLLIILFLISYLFTNSPLNLISRLSIQSIGGLESGLWIGGYSLIPVILFVVLIETVKRRYANR